MVFMQRSGNYIFPENLNKTQIKFSYLLSILKGVDKIFYAKVMHGFFVCNHDDFFKKYYSTIGYEKLLSIDNQPMSVIVTAFQYFLMHFRDENNKFDRNYFKFLADLFDKYTPLISTLKNSCNKNDVRFIIEEMRKEKTKFLTKQAKRK